MVPIIPISPFRTGTPCAEEPAKSIKDACETIDFFVITGQEIEPNTILRLIREARVLFSYQVPN